MNTFDFGTSFRLGQLVATRGALDTLTQTELLLSLLRHSRCDWGDTDVGTEMANDRALVSGGRLFSSYVTDAGQTVWVITERDRSRTTVLLPDEY